MYTRIVVPLDGSPAAEGALPEAIKLARLTGATMHLIQVMDLLPAERQPVLMKLVGPDYANAIAEEAAQIRAYLENKAARIRSSDIMVSVEVLEGRAVSELVRATKPGDIIVMTTHGRTGLRRVALGSVAEQVVRHTAVPVLLIKAGQEADDPAAQGVVENGVRR